MPKHGNKPKPESYEFVGRVPIGAIDLRGCVQICACRKKAVCEKGGRTVCRECADRINGQEFPLRTGTWRWGMSDTQLRDQLEMINQRTWY